MTEKLEIIISGDSKQLISELKRSGLAVKGLATTTQTASTQMGRLNQSVLTVHRAFSTLGLIGITAGVGQFGMASFKAAADAERLSRATGNLAKQIDETSESMVAGIQEASLGTIDKITAMEAANKAMMFGLVESGDQMEELTQIAVTLGAAMGQDATKSLDDLTTALGRQSPMILDNLGITLKLEEAYNIYAGQLGKTAAELTEAEKKQAFVNAALLKGQERVEALGGVTADTAAKSEQLSSAWQDFSIAFGGLLTKMTGGISTATAFVNELERGAQAWGWIIDETFRPEETFGAMAAEAAIAAKTQEEFRAAISNGSKDVDAFNRSLIENVGSFEEYEKILSDATAINASFLFEIDGSKESFNKAKEAIAQENEELRINTEAARLAGEAAFYLSQQQTAVAETAATAGVQLLAMRDAQNAEAMRYSALAGVDDTTLMKQTGLSIVEIQAAEKANEAYKDLQQEMTSAATSAAKSMSSAFKKGFSELDNMIRGQLQPTLQEVFQLNVDESRVDEDARRLATVVNEGFGSEFLTGLADKFGGEAFFQPIMDAIASGDTSALQEGASSILNDVMSRSMLLDTELIKERVRAQLTEQQLMQQLTETIRGEMLAEQAAGEDGASGLMASLLGVDDSGLATVQEGLAATGEASTASAETMMTDFEAVAETINTVSTETLPELEQAGTSSLQRIIDAAVKFGETTESRMGQAQKAIDDKLVKAVDRATLAFKKMADAAKQAASAASSAGNVAPGGGFGGGRAEGGPVSAGTTYLVGERGPELFTPRSSGSIIPNGGGITIGQIVLNGVNDPRKMFEAIEHEARARGMRFAAVS